MGTASTGTDGTWHRLLAFSLSLPEAYQDHPWGEVVAKVNKKVFAFLGTPAPANPSLETAPTAGQEGSGGDGAGASGDPQQAITVKLDECRELALHVEGAEPSGYGLGKHGWVTLPVPADADAGLYTDLIEESYRLVAPKRLVKLLDTTAAEGRAERLRQRRSEPALGRVEGAGGGDAGPF